jgi:hypothetical protein
VSTKLATIVAVLLAIMLASPQARAAVMPSDADADARALDEDADDRNVRGRDVVDLPSVAVAISRAPASSVVPTAVGVDGAATFDRDGSRARGPP